LFYAKQFSDAGKNKKMFVLKTKNKKALYSFVEEFEPSINGEEILANLAPTIEGAKKFGTKAEAIQAIKKAGFKKSDFTIQPAL